MQLQGLGSINLPLKDIGVQPGQKFLIEVINRDPGGKAQIRIGGQVIPALLEIPVQAGEKFWAGVQKVDASGILLVRDKDLNQIKGTPLDPQRVERLYIEFGAIRNNTLGHLLKQVLDSLSNEGKSAPVVSDGKGAPVVSDGKGAPVASDGKGTPVPSDGKGVPVASDGKGAPVVSDGKSAPVVSDGKSAPVVSDGKGASVVSDGKGAPVVSDGKGASVVSDGKGALIVSDGKGASVVSDGKGAPVVSDGKGAPVVSDGKGTSVVSDGKGAPVVSDSKGASVVSDGKGAPVVSDGKGAPVVSDPKNTLQVKEGTGVQISADKNISSSKGGSNVIPDEMPNLTGKEMIASFVHNNIPQWSELSKDGFLQLLFLLRGLGLDYERRLRNLDTMENQDLKDLQAELKRSLKGILLSLLAGDEPTKDEKPLLAGLLERLTGQQILLQGGNPETPFYLLEFPLQADGEIYTQTLAIKASRKGKKLDHNHCRVALHADTPTLGELGLEGWLYEGKLTLRVFSDDPDLLQSLIEANFAQTSELFKQMGIILNPIGVAPLKTAEEFQRFMQGEFREGVNYQV